MKNFISTGQMSYPQKEQYCETTFQMGGPFWHICTDGQSTEILFESDADYKFCITLIAVCSYLAGLSVIAFEVMSNHIHLIVSGSLEICHCFFDLFKKKLSRYFSLAGRYVKLDSLKCNPIPIESLSMLRTEIVYTHRNGYLVNDAYTPFSYPWGSGQLYFTNLIMPSGCRAYKDLSVREKKCICKSRLEELPDSFLVADGMFLPASFVKYEYGMSFFRDAHQYFSLISKNYEAFSAVAKRLGESIFLSDDELFAATRQLCKKNYNEDRPTLLPTQAKIELAKTLRLNYNASEGQIQRMLRLDRNKVAELFGFQSVSVHK